jgi:hypothetical protein
VGKNLWQRKKSTLLSCVIVCFRTASLKTLQKKTQ